jgi:DNA-binding transcriptional LysR family regulator
MIAIRHKTSISDTICPLRSQMQSADRLFEFMSVVDEGSISAAARAIELPRATLSRRLSALEADLGVRLLHRGTRRLVLTPAGEELYGRARRVVADTEAAWAAVRQLDDVPRGPLRISVPDLRAATSELFVAFARDYPEVRLEVSASSRHVDLLAEGIDVAVRFGPIDDPSLIARRIGTTRTLAVAAPSYLEARGEPRRAEDLADHDCIVGFGGASTPTHKWPTRDGGTVPINIRFASGGLGLRIDAALQGLGIALLPEDPIAQHLAEGRLRPVLVDIIGAESPANLVFVDREFVPAQVRAFIERAAAYFGRRKTAAT